MSNTDAKSKPALGFLTVIEHPQYGLFGGYLVLNTAGRPLEFHCTAPIKPNRAQQILYGPTLESFLYGEQIGQTLVNQASIPPMLICTDREPALAAREHVSMPVVLVLPPEDAPVAEQSGESGRILRSLAATMTPNGSLHVQTFDPSAPTLKALTDPKDFFANELKERAVFGYPPDQTLITIYGAGLDESALWTEANAPQANHLASTGHIQRWVRCG